MKNKLKCMEPIQIGRQTVKNRIIQSPAANLLCSDTGVVTTEAIEWAKARARGGFGVVTVGQSMVNPTPPAMSGYVVDLTTDKCINGLYRISEVIHQFGAKASLELVYMDFGLKDENVDMTEEDMSKVRTEESSGINDKMANKLPADLSKEDIRRIIRYYVDAAVRVRRANFDMVLVHGAHGMFISDFLSEARNKRTDEYGGSFENRCRIVDEILMGIRQAVGPDMAIEYRLSGEEKTEGGLTLAEQLRFAQHIEDKIDVLYVSAGVLENDEKAIYTFPTAYMPRGINVHYAREFKKVLSIPVGTVGGLDMKLAEKIIENGDADIITLMRTTIADPDAINKARCGRWDEIRPCVRCNTCINQPHYFFLPVRCAVNPKAGREADILRIPHPTQKQKVVVVGGGPGGMEAARTASERGHEVVLLEKDGRLGGMLLTATANRLKADMRDYLDWSVRMTLKAPGVTVRLNTEATPELVSAEKPDVVIVAVGAEPALPSIPGLEHAVWAGDVELGRVTPGRRVCICGGGMTGLECGLELAMDGHEVTIIEKLPFSSILLSGPVFNLVNLSLLLREHHVNFMTETTVAEIGTDSVRFIRKDGTTGNTTCDTVVNALGMRPKTREAAGFDGICDTVCKIGDCAGPMGTVWKAVTGGFNAAMEIY